VAPDDVGSGVDGVVSIQHEAGELSGDRLVALRGSASKAQSHLLDVAGHGVGQTRGI
jgi:hypothetical protein